MGEPAVTSTAPASPRDLVRRRQTLVEASRNGRGVSTSQRPGKAGMSHTPSRGPSDLELALAANTRATIAALDLERDLERVLRDLHGSQETVRALGHHPLQPTFSRPMSAADEVLRGVAFWDREPVDATPPAARLEVAR